MATTKFGNLAIAHFPNSRQIRVACGWTFNRTVLFDAWNIMFQVTVCCDNCPHCLKRESAIREALERAGVLYRFDTDIHSTRWVTIERTNKQDPVAYLRAITGLPFRRVIERQQIREWIIAVAIVVALATLVGWWLSR
jgi:hypothetical protein